MGKEHNFLNSFKKMLEYLTPTVVSIYLFSLGFLDNF